MIIRLIGRLLSGGFLFAALTSTPAAAAATSVSCNPAPAKLKATISDGVNIGTTSQTFENLAQSRVAFVQGGNAPSCVIVRFWGETDAGSNNAVNLRAILDNDTFGLPRDIRIGVPTASVARGYEFIFPNVAPGAHVIRMQWQSANGNSIFMQEHTTIVLFK